MLELADATLHAKRIVESDGAASSPAAVHMGGRSFRVAFLNTHPIQYFAPLYAYLNRAEDLSITALYLSDYSIRGAGDHAFGRTVRWDLDLLSGYDARFMRQSQKREEARGFFSILAPDLWREIRKGRYDAVVVHGHTPAAMVLGIVAAKASGSAVYMRGETHLKLHRTRAKALLRKPLIGGLYRWLDGVFAIGTANRDFYRSLDVPEHRIFSMPYTVDNARFSSASRLSREQRREIRRSFGVTGDVPIVLYAAKFQARKRPADLLRAIALLKEQGVAAHVVMVGSGELEQDVRALASDLGLGAITFTGFVNQLRLPAVYAVCDVFVLPSDDEPWGLVVNEAMCAGLPIVASESVGCVPDLVRNGCNGFTFPAGDVSRLAYALKPILADAGLRSTMGAESRAIVSRWSYSECLSGLREALARRTASLVPP